MEMVVGVNDDDNAEAMFLIAFGNNKTAAYIQMISGGRYLFPTIKSIWVKKLFPNTMIEIKKPEENNSKDLCALKKFILKTNAEIEEGLGLHYVRARLEESFPSRWFLDYGVKNGEWEVQITVDV